MSEIIRVNGLTKRYQKEIVLDQVSFGVESGRVIGLLGKNGIGKTTLLRILAGLSLPDEGEVLFQGKPMVYGTIKKVSYLMEAKEFYDWMTIKDAIQFYQDFFPDFEVERARKLCGEFELDPNKKIVKLSKGNQERVSFLLAICRRVSLYLMDEPMGGLDPLFKSYLKRILLDNIPEGATVIMATHLLKDLELLFDQVIIMHGSRVIVKDTDEIRSRLRLSIENYYMEVIADEKHC